MKTETLDKHMSRQIAAIAESSKDPHTKIGCIAVDPHGFVRAQGFNGLPMGLEDKPERYERPLKYKLCAHSEQSLVASAARNGVPLDGCIVYINKYSPCTSCARLLTQAGITEVVVCDEKPYSDEFREDCKLAEEMLREAGIKVRRV